MDWLDGAVIEIFESEPWNPHGGKREWMLSTCYLTFTHSL